MSATDDSGGVPLGWVLLFVLIALGATFGVILYAGGGDFGVVLPPV
jgi:hypothetical protein